MAIGISLDHGYILHLLGECATYAVQIALEGGEVDFRPASHGVHLRKEIDSGLISLAGLWVPIF